VAFSAHTRHGARAAIRRAVATRLDSSTFRRGPHVGAVLAEKRRQFSAAVEGAPRPTPAAEICIEILRIRRSHRAARVSEQAKNDWEIASQRIARFRR
jgi:hypothetical protein